MTVVAHESRPRPAQTAHARWASRAARWFYPYGAVRRVLAGPAKGLRFRVAPGMGVMYALGRDHREALDLLAAQLHAGQTVYDVGANQGQITLALARIVGGGGRVVAFEPVPENHAALSANVALNALSNVFPRRAAVGRTGGVRSFLFDADRNTMGTFAESAVKLDAGTPRIEVMTECIDELVAAGLQAPDCIKIDVEGAAGEVLRGAAQTLQKHRPSLFVELHLSGRHDEERQSLMDVARNLGYRVSMLDGIPIEDARQPGEYHAWCAPLEKAGDTSSAKASPQTNIP